VGAVTEVDLPHDGTPADALREGLHLLASTGMDVRADPAILLVALYLALVGAQSETLEDAPHRAEAWALGVAEDSPLVPVLDILLLAAHRGLDADTTLGHLYVVPAFTEPAPAADRRFTAAAGGALTEVAFELGHRQLITRDAKVIRTDADAQAMLQAQVRAFEDKFGRPPGPDDPVFFDPDADEPRPVPTARLEQTTTRMLQAAGICPAWIYANQHTDGLLPRPDGSFNSDADATEWRQAVDRYLRTHPGQHVDEAAGFGKLAAMLGMVSVDTAAGDTELGAFPRRATAPARHAHPRQRRAARRRVPPRRDRHPHRTLHRPGHRQDRRRTRPRLGRRRPGPTGPRSRRGCRGRRRPGRPARLRA